MIPASLYLLKVGLCSALLTGYYFIALRNKVFHQWNRFFLLLTVALSLVLPLMHFTILHTTEEAEQGAIKLLNAVAAAGEGEAPLPATDTWDTSSFISLLYLLVSILSFASLGAALVKIARIISRHENRKIQDICFVNTDVKGTPFSFFKYIFWNRSIDINSNTGTQIFKHELVHVREWHTLDKLFLQMVLVVFWCNPFFWLIRYELQMIHEFIADKRAVQQQNASELAALILTTVYPKRFAQIINPFFHRAIKRRLFMLTKIQSPRMNYASRLFILPLLGIAVLAFSVKTKKMIPDGIGAHPNETVTVVVDAGHGGNDPGAVVSMIQEKELTLAIAKQIKALNENENINIILTRSEDATMTLQNRIDLLRKHKADLLLSVHVNAAASYNATKKSQSEKSSGFEFFVQHDSSIYGRKSRLLGSALAQSISSLHKTKDVLNHGLKRYTLTQSLCPAVHIECGYLTNDADRAFIQQPVNQKAIARKILAGVELFLASSQTETGRKSFFPPKAGGGNAFIQNTTTGLSANQVLINEVAAPLLRKTPANSPTYSSAAPTAVKDTTVPLIVVDGTVYKGNMDALDPKSIHSVNVLKGESALAKYGEKGANGVIEITIKNTDPKKPLVLLDGIIFHGDINKLDANSIENVHVWKDDSARIKYGASGFNGVIEITSRKPGNATTISDRAASIKINMGTDPTFTVVQEKAQFPGGENAFKKYIEKNFNEDQLLKNGAPPGNYNVNVQFAVERDGTVSDLQVLSRHGYGIEEEVARLIKSGTKWTPAKQNNLTVRAYTKQVIAFEIRKS